MNDTPESTPSTLFVLYELPSAPFSGEVKRRGVNKVFEAQLVEQTKYATLQVGTQLELEYVFNVKRIRFQRDGMIGIYISR